MASASATAFRILSCLSYFPDFCQWWITMLKYKPNKPFPPKLAFGLWCLVTSIKTLMKTLEKDLRVPNNQPQKNTGDPSYCKGILNLTSEYIITKTSKSGFSGRQRVYLVNSTVLVFWVSALIYLYRNMLVSYFILDLSCLIDFWKLVPVKNSEQSTFPSCPQRLSSNPVLQDLLE